MSRNEKDAQMNEFTCTPRDANCSACRLRVTTTPAIKPLILLADRCGIPVDIRQPDGLFVVEQNRRQQQRSTDRSKTVRSMTKKNRTGGSSVMPYRAALPASVRSAVVRLVP